MSGSVTRGSACIDCFILYIYIFWRIHHFLASYNEALALNACQALVILYCTERKPYPTRIRSNSRLPSSKAVVLTPQGTSHCYLAYRIATHSSRVLPLYFVNRTRRDIGLKTNRSLGSRTPRVIEQTAETVRDTF